MYPIKDYPNPITRELIDLANEYGQSLEFAKDPKVRGDARRFVRFRFTNRPEMRAFERFGARSRLPGDAAGGRGRGQRRVHDDVSCRGGLMTYKPLKSAYPMR